MECIIFLKNARQVTFTNPNERNRMSTGNGIKILYIDDEINNLISLKALLRLDYQVLTTTNVDEVDQLLTQHPDIRIVFCDQRMPQKTGVEVFAELREKHPLPIRILVTAYTDVEDIIEAINRGHIFRYIRKPWSHADLVSAIEEASKFYTATSLLASRNQELQLAYNELDKFAYNVSHHIRSPITGILMALNMAMEADDITEIKDLIAMVDASVKKLDGLILNMYDYYNLRQGELTISFIDPEQLLQEVREQYSAYAQTEGVRFTANLAHTEPLRSDAPSIKFIITNLLSNAFKFRDKQQAEPWVSLDIDVERAQIRIRVSDNGQGIPAGQLSSLFDVIATPRTAKDSSGYGLSNVKHLLVKLGGNITAACTGGVTTFTVTIPNKY